MKVRERPIRGLCWLPNTLTFGVLSSAVVAILCAANGKWKEAVTALVIASILDLFDGMAARLTGYVSEQGGELDSLSDMVAFGVAPAVVMFHWSLVKAPVYLWFPALLFPVAASYRLARFNVMERTPQVNKEKRFIGLASLSAAGFMMMPLIWHLTFPQWIVTVSPWFVAGLMVFMAGLMVTSLPTPSLKGAPRWVVVPILSAMAIGALVYLWYTLVVVGVVYALCILGGWVYWGWQRGRANSEAQSSVFGKPETT